MSLTISNVIVDGTDIRPLAEWWVGALDAEVTADHGEFIFAKAGPINLGFQQVTEVSPGKNRLHLDLEADDRAAEVARLTGLGAVFVAEHSVPGFGWTVLRDPAGNEFCVSGSH